MSIVALRSATAADSEFCFQLHTGATGIRVKAAAVRGKAW